MDENIEEGAARSLEDELEACGFLPLPSPNSCIYKVPEKLCKVKHEAYKPQIISIGPYHRNTEGLHSMESSKERYFKAFLRRTLPTLTSRLTLSNLIIAIKRIESQARECYHDLVLGRDLIKAGDGYDSDTFVKMMILDGSFILELLHRYANEGARDANDPIFFTGWMLSSLQHDLVLIENQIPFIILEKLYRLTRTYSQQNDQSLDQLVLRFFKTMLPYSIESELPAPTQESLPVRSARYILGYLLAIERFIQSPFCSRESMLPITQGPEIQLNEFLPNPEETVVVRMPTTQAGSQHRQINSSGSQHRQINYRSRHRHMLDLLRSNLLPSSAHEENAGGDPGWEFTRCVTSLSEAGVKFVRKDKSDGLLDIKFHKGTFNIPPFDFDESTDVVLRNMIAMEQCDRMSTRQITSYVLLLDILMNSERDVKLLRDKKIIRSYLGDDVEMSLIINSMCKGVSITHFCYDGLCSRCNRYIQGTWYKWREVLMRDYFNTPWALFSFLAAIVLLILAITQTLYAVLAYYVSSSPS
ncbi:hypothetical protein C5167_015009 [Papaver somniferum]|uniref:Uncharacterized protein n=1 Tax=Papaver somniferum TaxID=3469 RepID=A0A4Y7J8A7_PAPSO|nr:UPF0481 protein At3g47200-like [Papaver somniferum]RZC56161.1 hypothetical protein C5167_015009 [Papaver somniferum]